MKYQPLITLAIFLCIAWAILLTSCGTDTAVEDYQQEQKDKQSAKQQEREEKENRELEEAIGRQEAPKDASPEEGDPSVSVEVQTTVRVEIEGSEDDLDNGSEVDPNEPKLLRRGLTPQQVEQILGEPTDSWLTGWGLMWKYVDSDVCVDGIIHCAVYFDRNKQVHTWINIHPDFKDHLNP